MTNKTVLEEVTLGMIVRDELMNAAGGLLPVLETQAPHYGAVRIADTGSTDGTRELLEELSAQYPHLTVMDIPFRGYGPSRQAVSDAIETPWIAWVDADEIIFPESVDRLAVNMSMKPHAHGHMVKHLVVLPGQEPKPAANWNPRVYRVQGSEFEGKIWEVVDVPGKCSQSFDVELLHFRPNEPGMQARDNWYENFAVNLREGTGPNGNGNFALWKTPHPASLKRFGISLPDVFTRLEAMGLHPKPEIYDNLSYDRPSSLPTR